MTYQTYYGLSEDDMRAELAKRVAATSKAATARTLDIAQGYISTILGGSHPVTPQTAAKMGYRKVSVFIPIDQAAPDSAVLVELRAIKSLLAEALPRLIASRRHLPEIGREVLALRGTTYYLGSREGLDTWMLAGVAYPLDAVTHWLPLPPVEEAR